MRAAITDAWLAVADRVAVELLGSLASEAELGDRVAELSRAYTRERGSLARQASAARALEARLRFFFLRDLPKIAGPLGELEALGALPRGRPWRVLDAGAGLGATVLGAAAFAARIGGVPSIHAVAIERDARAVDALERLARATHEAPLAPAESVPVELELRRIDLESAHAPGDLGGDEAFDLVLVGFALNELFADRAEADAVAARAALVRALGERLDRGGSMIILEPALRATSRALERVRDTLLASSDLDVLAPCVHSAPCPMLASERDWCHESIELALPPALARVARAAGLRWEGLRYSYLTLRRDGRNVGELLGGEGALYRIVSEPLASKGKLELFGCAAAGRARLVRLSRHKSESNAVVDALDRGWLVRVGDERISADTTIRGILPRDALK